MKKNFKWGRLSPCSKNKLGKMREYYLKRKLFLKAHPYCQFWLREHGFKESDCYMTGGRGSVSVVNEGAGYRTWVPPATDIHHMAGRSGPLLLDERYWMSVGREGHTWIHNHPKEAREKGYLLDIRPERIMPRPEGRL